MPAQAQAQALDNRTATVDWSRRPGRNRKKIKEKYYGMMLRERRGSESNGRLRQWPIAIGGLMGLGLVEDGG